MKPHNSFASDAKKRPKNAFKSQTGINLKPSANGLALGFFTEHGDGTLNQLSDYAGELYANDTLKKAVQSLINEKLLERKDEGGRRVEATYGLKGANG